MPFYRSVDSRNPEGAERESEVRHLHGRVLYQKTPQWVGVFRIFWGVQSGLDCSVKNVLGCSEWV